MEHVQPLDRSFSWRGVALAVGLVLVIALAAVGGMALLHQLGRTQPAAASRTISTRHVVPLRPRSHTSVLVLNGNGVNGAAGAEATSLLARGYRSADATNASLLDYARSLVLFQPGWQREARRLAHDARVSAIAPLDGRLPATGAHAQLVLILGR